MRASIQTPEDWRTPRRAALEGVAMLGMIAPAVNSIFEVMTAWHIRREAAGVRYTSLEAAIDSTIPLVSVFAFPYWSYFLLTFSAAYLTIHSRRAMAEVTIGFVVLSTVSTLSWWLFPIRMFRPELSDCAGMACGVVELIYSVDAGYNVFPSMHCAHTVMVLLFYWRYDPRPLPLLVPWGLTIMASTVLIKQHYALDLPPGILLGFVGFAVSRPVAKSLPASWVR